MLAPAAVAQPHQPPVWVVFGSETAAVDVSSFADRAARWNSARARSLDDDIERAQALAAMTRKAEEAAAATQTRAEAAVQPPPRAAAASASRASASAASASASPPPEEEPQPPASPPPEEEPPPTAGEPDPPEEEPVPAQDSAAEGSSGVEPAGDELALAPPADGPAPEKWLAMRHCESRHSYRVVSRSGKYRGAWQFSRTTWDWLAERNGHDRLVGVDPIEVSPADQDLMAYELYDLQGAKPWPVCGRHLR